MNTMTTTTGDEVEPELAKAPEEPSLPPLEWAKANLFSSAGNTVLTLVFALMGVLVFRGLVNFVFENADRDWDAIRANLRLFFVFAYPVSQFSRVWVSLGYILVLAGLTAGLWPSDSAISIKRLASKFTVSGVVIFVAALVVKGPLQRDAEGALIFTEQFEAVRGSWASGLDTRIWWFVIAAVLISIGVGLWFGYGEQRRYKFVSMTRIAYVSFGLAVLSLWVVRWGHFVGSPQPGVPYADPDSLVAMSTRGPWTSMWVVMGIGFLAGRLLHDGSITKLLRKLVIAFWALAPFILYWVILRDPALDYGYVFRVDIPMYLGFAVVGGAILYLLTKPDAGELGRLIAIGLVFIAVMTFVGGFFGWFAMLQKARISFVVLAAFGLAAPNFAGQRKTRLGYVYLWAGVLVVLHYFITMINAASTLELLRNDFLGGFMFSLFAAAFGLMFSFPLGVLLALARTSTLPIFRIMATVFIEVVRGIPFITVLFFFSIMLPLFLPHGMEVVEITGVIIGLVLFSAAYLAENVRGGLQSVRRGQYEASDAMGLTTSQRTSLIVLPQALQASIPPLVGQTISTYKETSLFAIIGIFDFLRIADKVIPSQSTPINFIGHKREGLLFVSVIYFVGSYAMSKYSQKLEKRLGVGER